MPCASARTSVLLILASYIPLDLRDAVLEIQIQVSSVNAGGRKLRLGEIHTVGLETAHHLRNLRCRLLHLTSPLPLTVSAGHLTTLSIPTHLPFANAADHPIFTAHLLYTPTSQ